MILKDLQLYKENNKYYLSAIFDYENKKGFYELSVPKIEFPVSQHCEVNLTSGYDELHVPYRIVDVDLGFGKILYAKSFNDEKDFFTLTCLEEKVHKMTLGEIEKELGYKIELQKEN